MRDGDIFRAELEGGGYIDCVFRDNPPRGAMKHTFFSADGRFAVQFYNNSRDARNVRVQERIRTIAGIYNPTVSEENGGAPGNSQKSAEFFRRRFCWPTAIVKKPEFGIVCPVYPKNFFFDKNSSEFLDLKGKDKKSNWFTGRNRKYLAADERGDLRTMLGCAISLCRSVRRMHQAGLAHSDLSCNNVLIDPKSGLAVVIDIDSLVVPGKYPPEVVGTRGYIAPEVLAATAKDHDRILPNAQTDLHALAVLIYEYLFFRHPLLGPKIYSHNSSEEDDFLALGEMATFIEDPFDMSNRPPRLDITIKSLTEGLEKMFLRAFTEGLHEPSERPAAMEWERELLRAWDRLLPCQNEKCARKWFMLRDEKDPVCPFCGTRGQENALLLKFKSETRGRKGFFREKSELAVYDNVPIFDWHIYANVYNDEKAVPEMRGYIAPMGEKKLLVNTGAAGMLSPNGAPLPKGAAAELRVGDVFKMSRQENGLLCEVAAIG